MTSSVWAHGFHNDVAAAKGKPCGGSWIGKNENCTKRSTTVSTAAGWSKSKKELHQRVSNIEKFGIGAGVVALGATALLAGKNRRLAKANQMPSRTPAQARTKVNTAINEAQGMSTAMGIAGAASAAAGAGLLAASRKEMLENNNKLSGTSAAKFAAGSVLTYAGTGIAMGSISMRKEFRQKKAEAHEQINNYERAYNQAQKQAKRAAEEAKRRAKTSGGAGWGRQRTKPNKAVQNPWADLGVSEQATEREITTAWKKLMRKHHPDMGGDPEKAKTINAAYTEIMRRMGRSDRLDADAWRYDAAGKPCGASHIPKAHKCSKSRTIAQQKKREAVPKDKEYKQLRQIEREMDREAKKSTTSNATAAKVALTAGLLAGGAALLKNRKKPISLADWRKSPNNPRNKPKLSPEEAARISKEAIAKGKKLDMARPGCSLKKSDSRTDAFTPAKSKCGSGAFGTYYVHPSKKYGVKTFTEFMADEADPGFEFDMLGKAHYAGVNVPEPLAMNSVARGGGEDRVETLIMTHMDGYKTLAKAREHGNFPTIRVSDRYGDMVEMPRLIQLNFAREMKKLHMAGMSHGDLHTGNLMYKLDGKDAKKIGIIDMGYAMDMDTPNHPIHGREPQENLLNDMRRMEDMLGIEQEIRPIKKRGLENLIEFTAIDYGKRWETYELAVSRYYDVVFRLINRNGSPRSKLLQSVEQQRIPGLNKEILRAAYSPSQLQFMNSLMNNGGVFPTDKAREKFQKMGMKLTEAKAVLASLQRS